MRYMGKIHVHVFINMSIYEMVNIQNEGSFYKWDCLFTKYMQVIVTFKCLWLYKWLYGIFDENKQKCIIMYIFEVLPGTLRTMLESYKHFFVP